MKYIRISLSALFLFSANPGYGYDHPMNIPEEVDQVINHAYDDLFNLKFDEAISSFESIQEHAEEHPFVAFALASAHWWRLTIYVLETNKKESRAFLDSAKRTIKICKKKIRAGDPDAEGRLVLGGIMGLLGRWKMENHEWLEAYFKGKKAYKHLKKAVKKNPDLNDAYFGLGMFDYFVATLPSIIQILAFLGVNANKEEGLRQLHLAAEKSNYANIPAKLFLAEIYSIYEDKPEKALKILAALKESTPLSPYIHILQVVALYNYGNLDELKIVSRECLEHAGKEGFGTDFITRGNFALGVTHFKDNQWEAAVKAFDKAIQRKNTIDPFYIWSYLYKGYALDVLGRRKEAVSNYKTVLDHSRRKNSHNKAKAHLKKPFTPDDIELKKLIL